MTGSGAAGAGVVAAVRERLRARYRPGAATVDRVTVGDRLVLVELDGPDGRTAGVAHRPPGDPPAGLDGRDALAAVDLAAGPARDPAPVARAVGLAAAGALSAPLVDWRPGDPMADLGGDAGVVATVGLFRPAFRKFGDAEVRVVERRPVGEVAVPAGVEASVHGPDDAGAALAGADVVFVTGSALVYGGADRYLALADAPAVVLVGATASVLPGPAFDAGATVVAGARVTDVEAVRRGILAGDCGTDLHGAGLEKVWTAPADRA